MNFVGKFFIPISEDIQLWLLVVTLSLQFWIATLFLSDVLVFNPVMEVLMNASLYV